VTAIDAGVLPGAAFVLMAIALVAAYVPAHRASRTSPIETLRYE
jgi:ABC-type lipoprotein release transport system permease subunit